MQIQMTKYSIEYSRCTGLQCTCIRLQYSLFKVMSLWNDMSRVCPVSGTGCYVTGTVLGTGCYRNCFGYWMLQELFCCLVLSVYPLFPLSDFPFQDSTLRVICWELPPHDHGKGKWWKTEQSSVVKTTRLVFHVKPPCLKIFTLLTLIHDQTKVLK